MEVKKKKKKVFCVLGCLNGFSFLLVHLSFNLCIPVFPLPFLSCVELCSFSGYDCTYFSFSNAWSPPVRILA